MWIIVDAPRIHRSDSLAIQRTCRNLRPRQLESFLPDSQSTLAYGSAVIMRIRKTAVVFLMLPFLYE